jgi:hypothetical protein
MMLGPPNPNVSDSSRRWASEIHAYDAPHARLQMVAAVIRARKFRSILDVGCAGGALGRLLPSGVRYQGIDFVESSNAESTIIADLNAAELPTLTLDADCIVLSGVLEYIRDPKRTLDWLLTCSTSDSPNILCTYFNDLHIRRRLARLAGAPVKSHRDWVPLMTYRELLNLLGSCGLETWLREDLSRGIRLAPSSRLAPEPTFRHHRRSRRHSTLLAHQWLLGASRTSAG